MKGTLHRRESNHQNLRTDQVAGEFECLPEVGFSFVLLGEALTIPGGFRVVTTSVVKSVERIENLVNFETQNSKYTLVIAETA